MRKSLFLFLSICLISTVFGLSNINGRNSFFIESGNVGRKKSTTLFFFHSLYNEDEIKVKLEFDDNKKEDNGIINLNLEYKDIIKYGFYYEKNIFFYNKSRYHGLSYIDKGFTITGGWFSGIREKESFILNGNRNFFLKRQSIIEDTETLLLNSRKLRKNEDYYIDYLSGVITLIPIFPEDSILECSYSYLDSTKKNEKYSSFSHKSKYFDYNIIDNIHKASIKSERFIFDYLYNIDDTKYFDSQISFIYKDILIKYFPQHIKNNNLSHFTGQNPEISFSSEKLNFDIFDTFECYYLKIDPVIDIGLLNNEQHSFFSNIKGRKGQFYFDSYLQKEENKGITADSNISIKLRNDLRFFQKDLYFRGIPIDREKNLVYFTKDFILSGILNNGSSSIKYSQRKGKVKKAVTFHSHKDATFEAGIRDSNYSAILTYDNRFFLRSSFKFNSTILSYEKREDFEDLFRIDIRDDNIRASFSYSKGLKEDTSIQIPIKENTIDIQYDGINNKGKYSYIVNIR